MKVRLENQMLGSKKNIFCRVLFFLILLLWEEKKNVYFSKFCKSKNYFERLQNLYSYYLVVYIV